MQIAYLKKGAQEITRSYLIFPEFKRTGSKVKGVRKPWPVKE